MHVESQKQRPLAVTIIAILMIIVVIAYLTIGTTVVLSGIGVAHIDLLIWAMALVIPYVVMAYGLWKGKRWAWTVTLILSVIQIILSVASIAVGSGRGVVIAIIVNALIIYYLYRPNVKEFFGKR
jgi:uncharacterized membrane protein (DUF2068 family)